MGIRYREEPIWVYCNQIVSEIYLLTESRRNSKSGNRDLILQSEIREKYMLFLLRIRLFRHIWRCGTGLNLEREIALP